MKRSAAAVVLAAALSPDVVQAFAGLPAFATSSPSALRKPVYSLQMTNGHVKSPTKTKSAAAKFAALASALFVGSAMPKVADAQMTSDVKVSADSAHLYDPVVRRALNINDEAPSTTQAQTEAPASLPARERVAIAVGSDLYDPVVVKALGGGGGVAMVATEDVVTGAKSALESLKDVKLDKKTVATVATVVSVGGLGVLLLSGKGGEAPKPKAQAKSSAPAQPKAEDKKEPAPQTKADPSSPAPAEDNSAVDFLLNMKKEELAKAGPMKIKGTSTKVGTRPDGVMTGTATVSKQQEMPAMGTTPSGSWTMGQRPPGYETTTVIRGESK